MKQLLIQFLKKNLLKGIDVESLLEEPKVKEHGDYSFPCFVLAKELKKAPNEIAKELEKQLTLPLFLEKIVATGPYLNFYVNKTQETQEFFASVKDKSLFNVKTKNSQKILIEYPSANTNKALHIGHSRNILLGNALSIILKKAGHKIIRTNLNNDRGIAMCKAMLSYKFFGENKTPQDLKLKPDEFVSHWYIRFGKEAEKNKDLEQEAQEMLLKWEQGDKEVLDLWKKLLKWVYEGYKETYKSYHLQAFEKEYYESEIYDKGKEIVLKALKNKVKGFGKEKDGAIYIELEDCGLDKKYLLRGDGTTLYMTQDIYLASLKQKEFKADKYIFVVGQEQEYHFKVLFEILERLGIADSEKNYHFSYGYIYNEQGKKFSSRLGNTIGADEILASITNKAKENLKTKELTKNLKESELNKRSQIIGYGALAFSFLKTNPQSSINFSTQQALSFEGETGPYVQYTYARIQSILRKAKYKVNFEIKSELLGEKELALVKALKNYPQSFNEAAKKYKISALAHFAIEIGQLFNDFYQSSPVLQEKKDLQEARLLLCYTTGLVIKETLSNLGIQVLDEM